MLTRKNKGNTGNDELQENTHREWELPGEQTL